MHIIQFLFALRKHIQSVYLQRYMRFILVKSMPNISVTIVLVGLKYFFFIMEKSYYFRPIIFC